MSGELDPALFGECLRVMLVVGGPLFGALLGVGLAVGALQTATQINDPAIGFVPRLLTLAAALAAGGGWMMESLTRLFTGMISGGGAP